MSRIDEMIREMCPGGVTFRPIWQLTTWDKNFNAVEKSKQPAIRRYRYLLAKEMVPLVVEGGDVKLLTTHHSNLWTTESKVAGPIHEAEVIAIPWGGNAIVQHFSGRFVTSDNRIAVANDPNELDMRFLYYFIEANLAILGSFYRGSGIKHPSMAKVLDWRVPVPPLEVQHEIVRVLDQFSQLEAELEAELEARRCQYEHYRRMLLQRRASDDGGAEILGDYVRIGGKSVGPTRMMEREVSIFSLPGFDANMTPEVGSPAEVGSAKMRMIDPCVLVGKLNPHIPRVWPVPNPVAGMYASPEFIQLVPREGLEIRYLVHLIRESMSSLAAQVTGSTNSHKRLQREDFLRLPVQMPSAERQLEIAELLDALDSLVQDRTLGLPAELAGRRKQYEYYRDELLTFEEATV